MPTDESLEEAWRDEKQQLLGSIRSHGLVLQRQGEGDEAVRAAVLEIRRAAHTLKGAARVMGDHRLEHLAHQLENDLPKPEEPLDPEAARQATAAFLQAVDEHDAVRPAEEPPPEPPEGGAEAPGTDEAPAEAPPTEPPRSDGSETMRASARHLADIASISEDLTVLTARGVHAVPSAQDVERVLAPLRDEIHHLERGVDGERRATAAYERFVAWLNDLVVHHRTQMRELRERVRALETTSRGLRAVRIDSIAAQLEGAALQVARDLGKEVRFELVGGEAELDRRVVDQLLDPLLHLLRNAVDHGIEPPAIRVERGKPRQGVVRVNVRAGGADVVIEVEDDGAGIPLEQVTEEARARGLDTSEESLFGWLFEPGFTTRHEATAISGRGLGLDVVRSRVTALRGRVQVRSRSGQGARFRIRVPADLSIARGWVVRVGRQRHLVLESSIERALRLDPADRRLVGGRPYVHLDGALWPLVDASALLSGEGPREMSDRPALALSVGDRRLVLAVDELTDAGQFVVKPLGDRVRRSGLILGASVLEDGYLACVLDPAAVARHATTALVREPTPAREPRRVLVADDSLTTRQLMVSILRTAGYVVDAVSDGQEAWDRLLRDPAPEAVVSDVEMPRVDGFQLLARIKSSPQTARLPVVLVTARSSDEDRRRALELGADGYVVKGRFDQRELLKTLSELLP